MTAAIQNFKVDQGATFRASVTLFTPEIRNDAGAITSPSAPYNLTGFTGVLALKREGTTTIINRSLVLVGNEVNLHVSDEDTNSFGVAGQTVNIAYEVLLTSQSGDTLKILKGVLSILGSFL